MGYVFAADNLNNVFTELARHYRLFAPKRFVLDGHFSDTDTIRYGEVETVEEIELKEKSSFSFKEGILPISDVLFYYTEDEVKEASPPVKPNLIFLRSCDLHSVKRLDEIYLRNGFEDYYYKRVRENTKFVLIGCASAFDSCFCVDMESNISTNYDASLDERNGRYYVDNKNPEWEGLMIQHSIAQEDVVPDYVTETQVRVHIPEDLTADIASHSMWDEYDARCIDCGRCNYSCPTCTCFTMQDVFYTDNGKVGERRRVWASCMVDGFTDVAGGGSYRRRNGERMRFKVLHKVLDFNQRNGYHMCTGCGRCDDVCPEYISFSTAINKMNAALKESN